MKRHTITRTRPNARFAQSIKQFLSAAAFAALFCAAATVTLHAQPATVYYDGTTTFDLDTSANGGSVEWSSSPSGAGPLAAWVNGNYASFTVTGLAMPSSITINGSVDTPGMDANPSGNKNAAAAIFHGSGTLALDADPNNTNGVYATFEMDDYNETGSSGIRSAFNFSGGPTMTDGPLSHPVPTGLYMNTETEGVTAWLGNSGECYSPQLATYSGNTWIGHGIQYVVENANGIPTSGTVYIGAGGPTAPTACLRSSWGAGSPKPTYVIPNPVVIGGNVLLDNGAGDNPLALTGPMTLTTPGCWLSANANTVSLYGQISGPGGLNLQTANSAGAGWNGLYLDGSNSYTGGTIFGFNYSVPSTLYANAPGCLSSGNVTVYATSGTVLDLLFPNTMSPQATLDIEGAINGGVLTGGSPPGGCVVLNFSGTQYLSALTYVGYQLPPGLYGTAYLNPNGVFSGPGAIDILPSITITSQSVSGGMVNLCWTSSDITGSATYNVLSTVGLGAAASWTQVNGSAIATQGTTTCYSFPVGGQKQFYVVQQPDPQQ